MLSGRPHVSACTIEDMLGKGLKINSKISIDYAQALLITFHSSLSNEDSKRLELAIKLGAVVVRGSSRHEVQTWQKIVEAKDRLESNPADTFVQDVLVEWKANAKCNESLGQLCVRNWLS